MLRHYNLSYPYSAEYAAIADHYGDKTAERSQVPLIAHIHEGCEMLHKWGESLLVQKAFCLHPLVQNSISHCCHDSPAMPLAKEYARIANSYLCRRETDIITMANNPQALAVFLGDIPKEVAWMLLADKIQNQKDFRTFHWFTHKRANELERYFNLWITTLLKIYL